MAKVILEQMLKERGLESQIFVDSAAAGMPTHPTATKNAQEAIRELYRNNLLVNHKSKSINQTKINDYGLILAMEEQHKHGLPKDKTYTLKEYAGLKGKIRDPYNKTIEIYRECRDEIHNCLRRVIEKIVEDC